MQLKKLTPNIMVEDVKRTITFYKDVLGFELVDSAPEEGETLVWAMMKRDGVEVMFQSRPSLSGEFPLFAEKAIGGALVFYIEVRDIQALYAALKERVPLLQDLHQAVYDAQEFTIQDCNGFVLTFAEPV